jgi:hypothetical protein
MDRPRQDRSREVFSSASDANDAMARRFRAEGLQLCLAIADQ